MAVGAAVSCPWFGPASYVWAALVAFYPFPAGSAMGPAWYHTCQFYNVLFFNHIRWCIRWQRLCACCGGVPAGGYCEVVLCFFCLEPEPGCAMGWSRPIPDEPDVAYPKCCARKTSVKKPIPPPKSLGEFGPVWKSTSVSGAPDNSSLSHLGDDAADLARSSGEEPASPRHRAGVASMAWRTTR